MSEQIEVSRDELYEAAWTNLMAVAAADFRMTRAKLKRLERYATEQDRRAKQMEAAASR